MLTRLPGGVAVLEAANSFALSAVAVLYKENRKPPPRAKSGVQPVDVCGSELPARGRRRLLGRRFAARGLGGQGAELASSPKTQLLAPRPCWRREGGPLRGRAAPPGGIVAGPRAEVHCTPGGGHDRMERGFGPHDCSSRLAKQSSSPNPEERHKRAVWRSLDPWDW